MLIMCGDFPTSPHFSICLDREAASRRFWRRLPSAKALSMNDSPIATAGLPDQFVAPHDEALSAFVNTLRVSVRAKVAAEQNRGSSLADIVVQVREMVRLAEQDPHRPNRFPPREFRAISRQAVGWCVESYRPLLFGAGRNLSEPAEQRDPEALPRVLAPTAAAVARFPASSPTYRGLP
jgi:hypothetical protein